MKIAQVSPLWERVPPPAYGGIEAVVALLADQLVRNGHEVTLYAAGDSVTLASLRSVVASSIRAKGCASSLPYDLVQATALVRESSRYDVIHNHCGELLMAFAPLIEAPMLTTAHGPMVADTQVVWDHYPGYFNTISVSEKDGFPDQRYLGVVYNGIDVDSYPFQSNKDDYLLFLGRVSEEKGTHLAIDVAQQVGRRLVIAGKVDRVDRDYYESKVAPRVDGVHVRYVGEADYYVKRSLFAGAACVLYPVTWPEPFGLVMAEAMACGTPIVALRRGSVPELIGDGETGFVVESVEQMVGAVGRISQIDPAKCRARVARLFSATQMVEGYQRLYEQIVQRSSGARASQ